MSEDVYGLNDEGRKIVTGRIIKLYEVQPASLLYNSSQYLSKYGVSNVNLLSNSKPVENDFTITIRFRDKDITYSMIKEGLYEPIS